MQDLFICRLFLHPWECKNLEGWDIFSLTYSYILNSRNSTWHTVSAQKYLLNERMSVKDLKNNEGTVAERKIMSQALEYSLRMVNVYN